MKDKNDFSKDWEKNLDFIKKETKLIGMVTSNPTLRKFLKNKGIPTFGQPTVSILKVILIKSIDSINYDKRFQKYLNDERIKFFSELSNLIDRCYDQSSEKTREILEKFLSILAIRKLMKIDNDIISRTLFNQGLVEIIQHYQDQLPTKLDEFYKKIRECATDSLEKAKKLIEFPDQFESVAKNIINEIKNNRESTRYVAGLIRALMDLKNSDLKNINYYFNEKYSAKFHYSGPFYRNDQSFYIIDYLNSKFYQKQANQFKSFKIVFEDWYFKIIEKIRHYEGHSEIDIVQDKLESGIYKIYIRGKKKSEILDSKLEYFQLYYEKSYDLLLLSKHIVARKFYSNDDDLFNYLAEPYEFD